MRKKKAKSLLQEADRMAQGVLDQIPNLLPLPGAEPPGPPTSPSALQGKSIQCFLCGGRVAIKLSKKGRPYFHCLDCYLQCFIRGDAGIKRLAKLIQGDQE